MLFIYIYIYYYVLLITRFAHPCSWPCIEVSCSSQARPGTLRAIPGRPDGAGGTGHGAGGALHHALAGRGLASVMMVSWGM